MTGTGTGSLLLVIGMVRTSLGVTGAASCCQRWSNGGCLAINGGRAGTRALMSNAASNANASDCSEHEW